MQELASLRKAEVRAGDVAEQIFLAGQHLPRRGQHLRCAGTRDHHDPVHVTMQEIPAFDPQSGDGHRLAHAQAEGIPMRNHQAGREELEVREDAHLMDIA